MKKIVALAAAAVLTLALLTTGYAKTLKLALDSDPTSQDPHVQLSGGMLQYSHLVFDPLLRWTKDMKFEPRLAEKWQRIDDKTMRFWLVKGVKFHSGNPLTSEDVKWTLERLKKSKDFKGLFEPFETVKVIDATTFDIVTKKPYSLVPNMCTYLFVLDSKFYTGTDDKGQPKDAVVKSGPSFANVNASGTGPFRVVSRDQGVKWVFERNKNYWDKKSKGNVEQIVFTPIASDSTRTAALLSGDVDLIAPIAPQDVEKIKKAKDVKFLAMSGTRLIHFQLNQKKKAEFKDVRVRTAIRLATNNIGIVQKLMPGLATAAAQMGPAGFVSHKDSLKPNFDLKKAQELMKQAGLEKGFECTMIAPNNRYVMDDQISQAFVAMLSRINIKVNLKTMPKAQYWDQFDAQAADIQMLGWHPDTEDSANYFEYILMCPNKETGYGQYNSANYCNPKLDDIIVRSQSEMDAAKRARMLQEAEQLAYDDAAFIPMHWQDLSWGAKKNVGIEDIVNRQDFPYYGDLVVK